MTVNDVILAMCSGALRAYLDEHDDLPAESLVAVMPVSLHTEGDADGNAITAISVRLATDLDRDHLESIATEVSLAELPDVTRRILEGQVRPLPGE